jgi:hypothetical protein
MPKGTSNNKDGGGMDKGLFAVRRAEREKQETAKTRNRSRAREAEST